VNTHNLEKLIEEEKVPKGQEWLTLEMLQNQIHQEEEDLKLRHIMEIKTKVKRQLDEQISEK
jgi:hypothetical protein